MRNKNDVVFTPCVRYNGVTGAVEGTYANRVLRRDFFNFASQDGNRRTPNPHSYQGRSVQTHATDNLEFRGGNYGAPVKGDLVAVFRGPIDFPEPSEPDFPGGADLAYQRALSDLNESVKGGLNLAVDLAESGQAKKMIRETGKFERYVKGFGPRRWANEWLQYKYGWQPLIGSIYGAANEVINNCFHASFFKGRGIAVLAPGSKRIVYSPGSIDFTGTGHGNYYYDAILKRDASVFHSCEFKVELAPPTTQSQLARWTSLNPLSIAWELVPYSFVVDWFFDVGSYMSDLETAFANQLRFKSGYRTTVKGWKVNEQLDYDDYSWPYFSTIVKCHTKGSAKGVNLSRVLLDNYPLPRVPQLNVDLNASRLISAAALLAQHLGVSTEKSKAAQRQSSLRSRTRYLRNDGIRFKTDGVNDAGSFSPF